MAQDWLPPCLLPLCMRFIVPPPPLPLPAPSRVTDPPAAPPLLPPCHPQVLTKLCVFTGAEMASLNKDYIFKVRRQQCP